MASLETLWEKKNITKVYNKGNKFTFLCVINFLFFLLAHAKMRLPVCSWQTQPWTIDPFNPGSENKINKKRWRIYRLPGFHCLCFWCLTGWYVAVKRWANLSERLSHLPQEVLGELDGLVHGKIQAAVADVLLNPARELPALVRPAVALRMGRGRRTPPSAEQVSLAASVESWMWTHLVSKDHQAVVGFPSDGSAHALGGVSHGVKREEVILPDLEVVPQVFQASLEERESGQDTGWVEDGRVLAAVVGGFWGSHLQDAALRVDVRHSEHDDRSAKVVNCTAKGRCVWL